MRFYYKYLLLIFFFFPSFSYSIENIAILDVDKLFSNSEKGKKIISNLNEIKNNSEAELKKKEEEIMRLDKDIQSKKNLVKEDELNKMISNMNNLLNNMKSYRDNYLNNYEKFKNEQLTIFFNDVSPLIEQYMINNSINIILDKKNVFITNQNNDITDDLLNIINKKIK